MAKKGIHPVWHDEAKVLCNGEEVLVTSGTRDSYTVDIWSGNHPFFQGNTSTVVTDEGRVNRCAAAAIAQHALASRAALVGARCT